MKRVSIAICTFLTLVAFALAVRQPHGIGNSAIALHRINIGVCHWGGAGSAGVTLMPDPFFGAETSYDDGKQFGRLNT